MGCCFSKELSRDNSEKTVLLEKSLEEKEPENKISKTLSLFFGALDSEELHSVGHGAGRVAGAQPCLGVLVQSGHTQGHKPTHLPNLISSSVPTFSARSDNSDGPVHSSGSISLEQSCGHPCDTLYRGAGSSRTCFENNGALSLVPKPLDWGVQEVSLVGRLVCPSTWASLIPGGKPAGKVQTSRHDESDLPGPFAREGEGANRVCMDLTSGRNSGESGFYSICVVDPSCLDAEEDLSLRLCAAAAVPECCSAVPFGEAPKGAWSLTCPSQGPGQLECLPSMPGTNEMKEVENEKTQLLTHNDLPCKINIGDVQAESLRADAYPGFCKDYPESCALHNSGIHPELNINTGTDSLTCVCAIPEEQERSGQVIPRGDSHAHLTNNAAGFERNCESGTVAIIVGQTLHFEKKGENDSTVHLRDSDGFLLDAGRLDSNLISVSPDGINADLKRCSTQEDFGNVCLPTLTDFREADPHRLHIDPGPKSSTGPRVTEELHPGQSGNLAAGNPHMTDEKLSLQSKGSPSHLDKGKVGTGKRASAWTPPCQLGVPVDVRSGGTWAQAYVGMPTEKDTDTEGLLQRTDPQDLTCSQQRLPGSRFVDDSRYPESHFISSTLLVTCPEKQKSKTGRNSKVDDEACSQISVRLENSEKESVRVHPRVTRDHDIEDVQTGSRTPSDWKPDAQNYNTLPRQESLPWVTSYTTASSDSEADQMKRSDEAHKVNDCGSEELDLMSPESQIADSCAQESGPDSSGENSAPTHVSSESFEVSAASEVSDLQVADAGEDMETCSQNTHRVDPIDLYGTRRHPLPSREGNARPTVATATFKAEVDFLGSPRMAFGKPGFCVTSEEQSCLLPTSPTTAISPNTEQLGPVVPGSSEMMIVPSVKDCFVALPEKGGHRSDLRSFPEERYSKFVNELSNYTVGELASQILPEGLTSSCDFPVGCVWTETSGGGALGPESTGGEDSHMEIQDWIVSSLWMQKPSYPPPVAADIVIWSWQDSGQLVSMCFLKIKTIWGVGHTL